MGTETTAMPLPVTPSYERRLRDLRQLSPATAALAERIALDLQPQVLATLGGASGVVPE